MIYKDQLVCPKSFPWKFANILASTTDILQVSFSNEKRENNPNKITEICVSQLRLYFFEKLTEFNLPIQSTGSSFSISVYERLNNIHYGQCCSYKDIAILLGSKNKARAVGHACSFNGISIIIPCHRIISSSGELTGYNWGLEAKKWLINHEKIDDTKK